MNTRDGIVKYWALCFVSKFDINLNKYKKAHKKEKIAESFYECHCNAIT